MITADDLKTPAELVAALVGSVLLLLPGWVAVLVYQRGARGPEPSDRSMVLQYAFTGAIVHLSVLWWTLGLLQKLIKNPTGNGWEVLIWAATVVVVIPAVLGATYSTLLELADRTPNRRPWKGARKILARLGISAAVRTAEAWTLAWRGIARLEAEVFVRVTKIDGLVVLGKYGEHSAASSDTRGRDLYLEELWRPDNDGWFDEAYPGTLGIWISSDQIACLEFFAGV